QVLRGRGAAPRDARDDLGSGREGCIPRALESGPNVLDPRAAEEREAPDVDARPTRNRLDLAAGHQIVAADEREPSELDLDARGHDRGQRSHEGDGGDPDLLVADHRLAK